MSQEDHEFKTSLCPHSNFKANLGFKERPCLKKRRGGRKAGKEAGREGGGRGREGERKIKEERRKEERRKRKLSKEKQMSK
jgi:hypothetical protein